MSDDTLMTWFGGGFAMTWVGIAAVILAETDNASEIFVLGVAAMLSVSGAVLILMKVADLINGVRGADLHPSRTSEGEQ